MTAVLPMEPRELEFVERLNGQVEIAPELLTGEPAMRALIQGHFGPRWKALNVKKHRGIDTPDASEPLE